MSKPLRKTITEGQWRAHIADESTAWEDEFKTREAALAEANAAIKEQGLKFFAQSMEDAIREAGK